MKTYRAAIIGLGRMGSTIDAEVVDYPPFILPYSIAGACKAIPRIDLVAGADILPEKRKAFGEKWGVQALYGDYLEMLEKEKPDLVAICTKGELHAPMTVRVAQAGVPMIFCEKAMACSLAEADQARDAVRKAGSRFLTGVLRRWHSRYQDARRRIAAGDIGKPVAAVHFAHTNLLHGHVHSIDTLLYLLGDPKAISVWGELRPRDLRFENGRLGKDPDAVFNLELEGGLEASTVPVGGWDFEVLGTEGAVRVANNGTHVFVRKKLPYSARFQPAMDVLAPPPPGEKSATVRMLEDLLDAHEQGRPTLGDIDVTHHVTEILFAIAECHRLGVPRITLPIAQRDVYIFHV
ncbi:MAG: Gfo/Idh/MocA family oxidoreductase [Armatimonadetes bacterium]|nr:Gfo/Idh/MocA family oxidoreductase [Planctomycetota bacterium]MBI2200599.1 Gfo/Idh/MocA family oxidoreductase [Armatimonadota bacterium]